MINILLIIGIAVAAIIVLLAFAWYRVVEPSEAHYVITPRGKFVAASDDKVGGDRVKEGKVGFKTSYFAIPSTIPFFGRQIKIISLTIKELLISQETLEIKQARYNVTSSLQYRVVDVPTAAENSESEDRVRSQLKEIVQSGVRAVTVKYNIVDARAKKKEIQDAIILEIQDELSRWGLELSAFVLVDFQDTADSNVISDISLRREVEIASETREMNAEKNKQADIKEAEAQEKSRSREIERDQVIAMREENKKQKVAEQAKIAVEKELEVERIEEVTKAKIEKDKQVVIAEQAREVEKISKEQKRLEGEGDRALAEEKAIGDAASIRENGKADAEAKELLQDALNKFSPSAIRALIAEAVVAKDLEIGVETAKALESADLKVFAGSGNSSGFDLGALVSSLGVADQGAAKALLNKLARPNDLGLSSLDLGLDDDDESKDDADAGEDSEFVSRAKKLLASQAAVAKPKEKKVVKVIKNLAGSKA